LHANGNANVEWVPPSATWVLGLNLARQLGGEWKRGERREPERTGGWIFTQWGQRDGISFIQLPCGLPNQKVGDASLNAVQGWFGAS